MYIKRIIYSLFLSLLLFPGSCLMAQNLTNLHEKEPVRITGSVAANQVLYGSSGDLAGRDPYSYYLMGRMNIALYGWSIPLSYRYSNRNHTFQQPFNQFSLSPSYKWIQTHIGYSSMSFSPYTLSGHLFYGAGLELKPTSELEVSLLYGRLKKATRPDTSIRSAQPSFRRMGYGLQTTLNKWNGSYTLTVFHSRDERSSLDSVPLQQGVLPEENLVLSMKASQTLWQNFSFDIEYAGTALTCDTRSAQNDISIPGVFQHTGGLFTPRQSSSFHKALKSSFSYQFESSSLALAYERIDPGYRTHGAYYFRNDLANMTLNAQTVLFSDRMNVSVNAGLQHDDLNNQKSQQMKQLVSSVHLGFRFTNRLTMNLSYSNFQSYTHVKNQFEEINSVNPYNHLDTLDFTQISQNMSMSMTYQLSSSKTSRQQVSLNGSWQQAASEQGDVPMNAGSIFYNVNAAYGHTVQPIGLSLNAALSMNHSRNAGISSAIWGPTLSVNKSFFDRKLRSAISSSYNRSYSNHKLNGTVMNVRLSNGFKWKKQHTVQLSMMYMKRKRPLEELGNVAEFTLRMNYNYRFR